MKTKEIRIKIGKMVEDEDSVGLCDNRKKIPPINTGLEMFRIIQRESYFKPHNYWASFGWVKLEASVQ